MIDDIMTFAECWRQDRIVARRRRVRLCVTGLRCLWAALRG